MELEGGGARGRRQAMWCERETQGWEWKWGFPIVSSTVGLEGNKGSFHKWQK